MPMAIRSDIAKSWLLFTYSNTTTMAKRAVRIVHMGATVTLTLMQNGGGSVLGSLKLRLNRLISKLYRRKHG